MPAAFRVRSCRASLRACGLSCALLLRIASSLRPFACAPAARRFMPAAASLRGGMPLRGYPSHVAVLVGPSRVAVSLHLPALLFRFPSFAGRQQASGQYALRAIPPTSLRSWAPPAHGAAGGYAARRLTAIRLRFRSSMCWMICAGFFVRVWFSIDYKIVCAKGGAGGYPFARAEI